MLDKQNSLSHTACEYDCASLTTQRETMVTLDSVPRTCNETIRNSSEKGNSFCGSSEGKIFFEPHTPEVSKLSQSSKQVSRNIHDGQPSSEKSSSCEDEAPSQKFYDPSRVRGKENGQSYHESSVYDMNVMLVAENDALRTQIHDYEQCLSELQRLHVKNNFSRGEQGNEQLISKLMVEIASLENRIQELRADKKKAFELVEMERNKSDVLCNEVKLLEECLHKYKQENMQLLQTLVDLEILPNAEEL